MNSFHFQQVEISADLLSLLSDFTCGVSTMDAILHSQCLFSELNIEEPIAYCVYNAENMLVGFCIVGKTTYSLEYDDQWYSLPMIDIACLAVHTNYRYQGVGTAILNMICTKAAKYMPEATHLHVDALDLNDGTYSAVGFYEQYHFEYYARSGPDTAKMFYQLNETE